MQKVILVGGSPMIGKSTVASYLSLKTGYAYMSTDDIGEVFQTVKNYNPMRNQNYLDYYENTDIAQLIDDIQYYHTQLDPSINRLISIHSTWGNPIIIEGWALYPKNIKHFSRDSVSRIWLISDEDLLRERLIKNTGFYGQAHDEERVIHNYLQRSIWHNNLILEQCKIYNEPYIFVNSSQDKKMIYELLDSALLS